MFQTSSLPEFYPQARASFSPFSYFSLCVLLTLLRLRLDLVSGQSYNLVFDHKYSPPAGFPTDPKDYIYSVPLNQLTSQATLAYIKDNTGKTVTTVNDSIKVYVTSMDKSQSQPNGSDKWRDSGGKLCQWTVPNLDWPRRHFRHMYNTTCGSSLRTTTLIAKILSGKIIIDWIMHVHPTGELPADDRFIRVDIPDLKLSKDTNPFRITEPAARLSITKQPSGSVLANNNFSIEAEIQNKKGVTLTVGLDSVAYVELTVSYEYKIFHDKFGKDMMLKSTKVRLSGPLVKTYLATRDLVIRQRAVAGKVSFIGIRILDYVYGLKLNLTMYMSKDPFLRIPNCKECYSDLSYKNITSDGFVQFRMPPSKILKNIPSMKFTKPFDVLPQTYAKLKYTSKYQGTGKMIITRNFPIPGPLTIEIQDKYGNRIYSGANSDLPLTAEAVPNVCLSRDYQVLSLEGIATFSGSICENINSVFLIFYSKKMPTLNVTSQEMQIVGNVHIAHFDHFEFTGAGRDVSPHVNSFIHFAASDVNAGIIPGVLRPFNMKLIVNTIETKNDISNTLLQYRYIGEEAAIDPSSTIRVAILSGNSDIYAAMARQLSHEHIPQISLDEKGDKYSNLPYFNRVCWNSRQIYETFFQFCHERHWINMIVLKTSNTYTSRSLNRYARYEQIELHEVVIDHEKVQWGSEEPDNEGVLSKVMQEMKKQNIKVIACFANHTQVPSILRIAKNEGLSPEEGYQWIFATTFAWGFPFNNSSPCDVYPQCTTVFKGTILFTETYNTTYMHSIDWERVLNYYFSVDKSIYLGLTSVYPNNDQASRMALGYDATWLYAEAIRKIVSRSHTATTKRVIEELRTVTIDGLSGTLKLDAKGDREGFQINVRIISATQPKQPMEAVAPLYKYIEMRPDKSNIEYVYEDDKNTTLTNETILEPIVPKSRSYNIRSFKSKSGRVSKNDLRLIKYSNETWPTKDIIRKEWIIPPFTCSHPCGNIITKENINKYDRGICIKMDVCRCHQGYFAKYCQKVMCRSCTHGHCKVPSKCICDKGYMGDDCSNPICPDGCGNGVCVQPNKCHCFRNSWVGRSCHIHLAGILVPLFIFLILFIYLGHTFFIFLRRRIERTTALSNLDWLVDWQEVIRVDRGTLKTASLASSYGNMALNACSWRKRKWFIKKINSNTVDQDNVNMHLEMVELISLSHQNLITYGGACLVNPNVSFLVEVAQKGSLDDILLNETIQLDWNFRISFMKDICRGMNFLHTKTNIGSHGRLKSSNCLLDNRWCIRITDFGAPTIRYGPYVIEKSDDEKSNEYYIMQEALLWTAPELLENAACLDDVQIGTKEGDIYSFAIVISEIATRDVPFAYERGFLSTCGLIDLIVNQDNPLVERELRIWESLGNGMNLVRPYISSEYLPEGNTKQSTFLKMLDDIWTNDPLARITFPKLTRVLNHIFPTKEELMDNLMHLLESYSNNLEQIVKERTDALDAEKTKVENIVSQMLPKKVIDELKTSDKVEPENFECVTVYYSDIVGFTSIAKSIQPMQVVDLLNDLYSLFDGILSGYDVYKVETIGDAYVVASGVPTLNANLHAGEIATAALDVMSAIMRKEAPHQTNVKLQMRLGINTGPVVAGVVGLKMPRYTLFGDTMQIAAIMESSSKAMHIQMSEYTVNILKELGDYTMKYRGNVTVCGRNITTYWLTGKIGFNKPLPEVVEE